MRSQWVKNNIGLAIVFLLLSICTIQASARASQEKMTFLLKSNIPDIFSQTPMTTGGAAPEIIATGKIDPATGDAFKAFLKQNGKLGQTWRVQVRLNSGGGSLVAGLQMGRLIRQHQMSIVINDDCASACAYAAMGGVTRQVDHNGRIGLHQFSRRSTTESLNSRIESDAQIVIATLIDYVQEMGVDPSILSRASKTSPEDIWWLSPRELVDYGFSRAAPPTETSTLAKSRVGDDVRSPPAAVGSQITITPKVSYVVTGVDRLASGRGWVMDMDGSSGGKLRVNFVCGESIRFYGIRPGNYIELITPTSNFADKMIAVLCNGNTQMADKGPITPQKRSISTKTKHFMIGDRFNTSTKGAAYIIERIDGKTIHAIVDRIGAFEYCKRNPGATKYTNYRNYMQKCISEEMGFRASLTADCERPRILYKNMHESQWYAGSVEDHIWMSESEEGVIKHNLSDVWKKLCR